MVRVPVVAGALLLLGGVLLGFRSVSEGQADCGSVFSPAAGITPMACDRHLDRSLTLVLVVVAAGLVCLLAAAILRRVAERRAAERRSAG